MIRLVYPQEAGNKGNLGGPLVSEWMVVKDEKGAVTGLTYEGNDRYTLMPVEGPREW